MGHVYAVSARLGRAEAQGYIGLAVSPKACTRVFHWRDPQWFLDKKRARQRRGLAGLGR